MLRKLRRRKPSLKEELETELMGLALAEAEAEMSFNRSIARRKQRHVG